MGNEPEKLIAERHKTHGDYDQVAIFTQSVKETWRRGPNWGKLTASQALTLDEIAHKVARILTGDPNQCEHWDDIAGYARLISKGLEK